VNDTEDGIKFENIEFKELTDVPNDFTDLDKYILSIDEEHNRLVPIEFKTTNLIDMPIDYNGQKNKILKVNDTEDGIKFEDITFRELTDTPNAYNG